MTGQIAASNAFARAIFTEFKSGVRLRDLGVFLMAVHDPPTGQIVGRHFNPHPVAKQDADVILAHLARKISQYFVAVIQLNFELSPG